jgi:hypothetical protein
MNKYKMLNYAVYFLGTSLNVNYFTFRDNVVSTATALRAT